MAGLLDYLFDPSTYGDQQGGLLSRLSAMQGNFSGGGGFPAANNQQPPASFADRFNAIPNAPQPVAPSGRNFDETFAQVPNAPNQAQPIAVGNNYQMPRVGVADLFNPQQVNLPQNAQPAQGMQPQQPPQMQQMVPPALGGRPDSGFFDRLNNGLQSIGSGGSVIGALTGNRTDPQSIAQQNLNDQFQTIRQTLIANGEKPDIAFAKAKIAAMNPEAAKTILPELFTSKQEWGVVSEDPLEGKKYGFINKRDQTINDKPINSQSAPTGGGLAGIQAAQNAGIKGDALYEHLPASMRNTVKAMIEGRQPLPSTAAMRSPATLAMIDAAHTIDPTFDATVWKSRNEAGPDWSKGKSSEMVRSANQTLAHVGSLMNAMDDLKNTRIPAANWVGNTVRENLGSGEQGAFRTNAHAVAEEMSKVFKGANLSDAEIRHWEQNLSENMSPAQQKAQIAKLSELLHGSLQALEEKRLAAMGPAAAEKAGPLIKSEGQAVLKRIDDWVKGNGAPAQAGGVQEGATATNPQTGAKITFRNGKWQ